MRCEILREIRWGIPRLGRRYALLFEVIEGYDTIGVVHLDNETVDWMLEGLERIQDGRMISSLRMWSVMGGEEKRERQRQLGK
jgi:hypothetical protein